MTAEILLADCRVPVLGIAAYSGTGKTTLLLKLLPELNRRGLKVAVLKHAHHNFDVDEPGKDSYELRHAGASQMLIASSNRRALMTERVIEGAPCLKELLGNIDQSQADIILVEGFKKELMPKLELHRACVNKPFIFEHDDSVIAIATDEQTQLSANAPALQLDINDHLVIADFIEQFKAKWQPVGLAPLGPCCDDGGRKQLSVQQGIERILAQVTPLTTVEQLPLLDGLNRITAQAIQSPIQVPQQTNSAMDGYAIAYDAQQASYAIVGEVFAGYHYDGILDQGQAVRIMTGAPLPAGADTVVMREVAQLQDQQVSFDGPIIQGQNVRQAGEDLNLGDTAIEAGTRLQSAEIGLLASLGMGTIEVLHRPKVAIFSTGDEVCAPGEPLKADCIYDANRFTLHSMLNKLGCEVLDLGIIEDNEQTMVATLKQAAEQADMVLSSGGVSVGDADYIKLALEQLGSINFWKIAQRPGRPLAFGQIAGTPFFGLPGNPVAVMVSFLQFVQPALRKMAGEPNWQPKLLRATATEAIRSKVGRTEFQRGVMQLDLAGQLSVKTTGAQGSGILRSMVEANCLIIVEEPQENVAIGDQVWVQPFSDQL